MDELTRQIGPGLRQGSRDAWAKLYDAYAGRLWREVSRLAGPDAADIADVVQEVFLVAAKSARHFDEQRGSLWVWLSGIARRQTAELFRRRIAQFNLAVRWWQSLDGSARQWLAGTGDAPDTAAESKELGVLVRAALLELPDDYRTLLSRRYLDDAKTTELARELSCSVEAVRAKLLRARRAFREHFEKITGPAAWPGSRKETVL